MISSLALLVAAGTSPPIASRLRAVAAQYYAAAGRIARVTSRDTTMDYYTRLQDDADFWSSADASFQHSQERRATFTAMSELDMSLATQLIQRSPQPMGAIRGLGETLVASSKDGTLQPVAVYVPTQYSTAKPAQLIVFLHGRDQPESHLMALPLLTELAERTNTIVVAPYGRGYYDFKGSESDVYDALSAANAAFSIEPSHRYLAGYSMGGFATFSVGPMNPGDWAGILCVSGSLVEQKAARTTTRMRNLRFYVVTGAEDATVPTLWPELTAAYLRDNGMQVSFYSEPHGTHDLRTLSAVFPQAWTDMERGLTRLPWDLPSGGGLPVAP